MNIRNPRLPVLTHPFALLPTLLMLLVPIALTLAWRALERLLALLQRPYSSDGLEGTLLHEARLLYAGESLYQPLELYRFVSAPYPPLHPVVLGLVDQMPGSHVFYSGRLISLISALLIGTLIILLVWRVSRSLVAGVLAAPIFLAAPPVILWATRIKPDLFALLWTTLGLAAAIWATTTPHASRTKPHGSRFPYTSLLLAAGCFALAFFTKQTAVAAPLAVGIALLLGDIRAWQRGERDGFWGFLLMRKRTVVFSFTYLGLVLGTWLLLDLVTSGQFTAHVWGLHRREWWSEALFMKFARLLLPYWPLMLLSAILVFFAARDTRALIPLCYALVAPVTLLGAGETGANHNHLLESLLAFTLAAGCTIGWAANWLLPRTHTCTLFARPLHIRGAVVVLPLLLLVFFQFNLAFRPQEWYIGELNPPDTPERYLHMLRNTPGEILADDISLLLQAEKPIRYDDPSTMGPAAASGVWDQSGLIDDIANRRFTAILIPVDVENELSDPAGRWSPEVIAAINTHYRLQFRDTINTYVPR